MSTHAAKDAPNVPGPGRGRFAVPTNHCGGPVSRAAGARWPAIRPLLRYPCGCTGHRGVAPGPLRVLFSERTR
eukprot:7177291-Lingulodinium_polyedra.AAC.1